MSERRGKANRFDRLLSGESKEQHDKILYENNNFVVAPTLGSIVPNWLLIFPRQPSLSFGSLKQKSGFEPTTAVIETASHLGLEATQFVWFEHGPSEFGSSTGCGLDYAHIHLLIEPSFSLEEFFETAKLRSDFDWESSTAGEVYNQINPSESYLVAGCADKAIIATNVESAGSQFFRRIVAEISGVSNDWDYKTNPNLQNIEMTIQTVSRLVAEVG